MAPQRFQVLVLCTGNSARSILAQCALNRRGTGRLRAFSAGSRPVGVVHPDTLTVLREEGFAVDGLRSKSWDEFAGEDAPVLDFVFTVCDSAAGEACPLWPGNPLKAHWGVVDPAAFQGAPAERLERFRHVYRVLDRRVERFLALPLESLDRATLQQRLDEIGAGEEAPGS